MKERAYTYINKNTKGEVFMEYAKDEIFQIRYNTTLDRLEMKPKRWTSRIKNKMKQHKLLTATLMAFVLFSIINVVMIYNFVNILQNV